MLQSKNHNIEPLLDIETIRKDFPILNLKVHQHDLIYFDNAATTQKPEVVLDAMDHYYQFDNANVHRGVHTLSQRATEMYENTRKEVAKFINARHASEIVFTRGTTESINLVAASFGRKFLRAGDEIIISQMEHHSNIVPWQLLCENIGCTLKVIPITERGELQLDAFAKLLSPRTKLVAVAHISNALGTINPIKEIITMAHDSGAKVLIDGAQAAPHLKIDVQALDCDFYAFSGHKVYGPTGIGVLYGKAELLDAMPPYQGGGEMIKRVSFEKTTYHDIPHRFEAGTPNIAGVAGLRAALNYLTQLNLDKIAHYEQQLLVYATEKLQAVPGLRLIGTAENKACILSFLLETAHAHDVGTILDHEGIAIRTGHHCAMPVMEFFGVPATTRASLAFYNTQAEIDKFVAGLYKVMEVFGA